VTTPLSTRPARPQMGTGQPRVVEQNTSALAAKAFAAIRGAHARGCLSDYLDLLFKGKSYEGAHISQFTITAATGRVGRSRRP
jgi:hypothetical protein